MPLNIIVPELADIITLAVFLVCAAGMLAAFVSRKNHR